MYWSKEAALVGSSNASINGLRFEGKDASGRIEVNALIDDVDFLVAARLWFDGLWNDRGRTYDIDDEALAQARAAHKRSVENRQMFQELDPFYPVIHADDWIKRDLIHRFVIAGEQIWNSQGFPKDVTARTARHLMETDPDWRTKYNIIIHDDSFKRGIKAKRGINPLFGKALAAKLGARSGDAYRAEQPSIFYKPTRLIWKP